MSTSRLVKILILDEKENLEIEINTTVEKLNAEFATTSINPLQRLVSEAIDDLNDSSTKRKEYLNFQ